MRHLFSFLLGMLILGSAQMAFAQETQLLKANGSKTLKKMPQELVVSLEFLARDKTMKESIAKLESRQKTAEGLLKTLGADLDSIKFSMPTTSSQSGQQMQQLQEMFRERIQRSGGATPEGLKLPEMVSLSSTLTVRWPLKEGEPTALLTQIEELKRKIEEADIASIKEEQPTLAEQEMLEEAQAMGYDPYRSDEEVKPGTPQFFYRARITEEDRKQAMKEAYRDARKNADQLAAAGGMKVARLHRLDSAQNSTQPINEYGGYYRGMRPPMSTGDESDPLAAQGMAFEEITFQFVIIAEYEMVYDSK